MLKFINRGFEDFFLASSEAKLADFGRGCLSETSTERVPEDPSFMALGLLLAVWTFPDLMAAVDMLGCWVRGLRTSLKEA